MSRIGVRNYTRLGSAKSTILTNKVSFVTILVCIIVFLNYWYYDLYFVGYVQIATIAVVSLSIFLNYFKRFTAAKVALFVAANANIFMTSSSLGYASSEHYGYFPIIIGLVILFEKRERIWLNIFVVISCLCMAALIATDYSMFAIPGVPSSVIQEISAFNTAGAIALILVCIKYFRTISDQHISDIIKNTYDELKGVFDHSHDAILLLDPQSYAITEYNDRAGNIFRYSVREDLINKSFFSLLKDEQNEELQQQIKETIRDKRTWISDDMYLTSDGHEFWGNLAITQMVLEDRDLLVARITDITENKQVAILLENLTKDLKKVQGIIQLGYWHLDVASNMITYYSEEAAEQFGLIDEPKEVPFDAFTESIHPADLPRFLSSIERSLKFQVPFELELRVTVEQGVRWLYTKSDLVLKEDNTVSNIVCTSQDITDRKIAEERIKTSERNYRKLASNLPDTDVFLFDENLKVILAEGTIMQKHHMSSSHFEGKNIDDIMDRSYRAFIRPLYETVLRGKSVSSDVGLRDGFVNFRGVPLRDASQKVYGGIMVCQDITARKSNEQELIKAKEEAENASRAKALFLSTMSHELRTPLNAVIGMSHLLLQENPRPDQVDNLKVLHFSAENLLALINDILDFSKIDANKVEFEQIVFDLRSLCDSIILSHKAKAKEKQLSLTMEVSELVPARIIGDPTKLSQILNNLISNAIKFTDVGHVQLMVQEISRKPEETTISFRVSDTGVGISKDKLEVIFEQFSQADSNTTRKYGGTGLGLTITKRLLELQNSRITVESDLGEGASFEFELTFSINDTSLAEASPAVPPVEVKTELPPRTGKVLMVEDNPANVLILSKFLDKWGMEYDSADNGLQAVEMVAEHQYDLILMDLQMPVMDGYASATEIRKTNQYTPIIALTASALSETLVRIKTVGMDDLVTKPFNPSELQEKISGWVQSTHQKKIEM